MRGRPVLIGLAGSSASGKSTLAERAQSEFGAELIKLDKFFKDAHEFPMHGPWRNWELPENLKWDELYQVLLELKAGHVVRVPEYSKPMGRQTGTRIARPTDIVLVEGFLLFHDGRSRDLFDHKLYLRVAPEAQLARRLARQPGTDRRYFEAVVRPAFDRYGAAAEQVADVVLDGNRPAEAVWREFRARFRRD